MTMLSPTIIVPCKLNLLDARVFRPLDNSLCSEKCKQMFERHKLVDICEVDAIEDICC